jgi:hypothetical protein
MYYFAKDLAYYGIQLNIFYRIKKMITWFKSLRE